MKFTVDLQQVCDHPSIPNRFTLQRWVNATLSNRLDQAELCIRIVDADESQQLNNRYRGVNKPTNVLSFPYELPPEVQLASPLLGDLVLCASIIVQEAQQKAVEAHWAHMVIHGLLHLLGFDHQSDLDANIMEQQEIDILQQLALPNPYQVENIDDG